MRRKIAKRLKKKLIKLGCEIRNPHFVSEPGWPRKQCGYAAEVIFKNCHIYSCGYDELHCYRMALETVMEEIREPYLTKPNPEYLEKGIEIENYSIMSGASFTL